MHSEELAGAMAESEHSLDQFLIAVVQSQDGDQVQTVLEEGSYFYARLPSTGGFLREHNVTFLIGCESERHDLLVRLLSEAAKKRVTYVSAPIDGTTLAIPIPAETVIGGISILTLPLEHFEEI
jgi:uncharacterized protein YaaQ